MTQTAQPTQQDQVRVERSPKRIRTYLGGALVADTLAARLVWEIPYYPVYYLPLADVRAELVDTGLVERMSRTARLGDAEVYDVKTAGGMAPGAARRFPAAPVEEVRGLVRFDWEAMDEWLEEDEPVYVHARSPYARVDILASSRRVQVAVNGVQVADSVRPRILFETGLPPRYYLPLTDIRLDLLRQSDTHTRCPYKGTADYWSVEVDGTRFDDYVWIYRTPVPESQKIAGLACFYNEKVDITVDGVLQERPRTPFS
jgi:uncharacterized protein (DUF427 family)